MSLGTGAAQLHSALKTARQRLSETRPGWNDDVRREFDENHWTPLEREVAAVILKLEHLDQVLAQMRQECG
jgi:hypothetical protein